MTTLPTVRNERETNASVDESMGQQDTGEENRVARNAAKLLIAALIIRYLWRY